MYRTAGNRETKKKYAEDELSPSLHSFCDASSRSSRYAARERLLAVPFERERHVFICGASRATAEEQFTFAEGRGGEKEKRRRRRRRKLNSVCRLGRAANSAQTQLQKRYTFFLFSVPTTISDPTQPRSCSDLPMESSKVRSRLISRTEPIIVQDQSGSLNRWVALK